MEVQIQSASETENSDIHNLYNAKTHGQKPLKNRKKHKGMKVQVTSTSLQPFATQRKTKNYYSRVLGTTADETLLRGADIVMDFFENMSDYGAD